MTESSLTKNGAGDAWTPEAKEPPAIHFEFQSLDPRGLSKLYLHSADPRGEHRIFAPGPSPGATGSTCRALAQALHREFNCAV